MKPSARSHWPLYLAAAIVVVLIIVALLGVGNPLYAVLRSRSVLMGAGFIILLILAASFLESNRSKP